MIIRLKSRKLPLIIAVVAVVILGLFAVYSGLLRNVSALSKSDWKAGMIISDGLFYDNTQMSTADIQNWLNKRLTCDTNGSKPSEFGGGTDYNGDGTVTRAEWARTTEGYTGKFVCLRDYYENPTTNASNLKTGTKPSGSISAAAIIKQAADTYKVSPKVLLVKLKAESLNLTSDEWPWPSQFHWAMGYGCPDPPPGQPVVCDPEYKSFYQQITWAARGLRNYVTYADSFRYKAAQNNTIQYNPDTRCGSSTVYIENHATAGLYNYTPYQPNSATINWKLGTGPSVTSGYNGSSTDCGAFGNINFLIYYNEWFGSTRVAYDAELSDITLYSDASRTTALNPSSGSYQVSPGQTIYGSAAIKNIGSKTLSQSFTKIGTTSPTDRGSAFYNDSWLSGGRMARLNEASLAPTEQGTFTFSMTVPRNIGIFTENFGIVAEERTWLTRDSMSFKFNISPSRTYDAELDRYDVYYDPHMKAKAAKPYLLRPGQKLYVKAIYKNIGSSELSGDTLKIAPVDPRDRIDSPYLDDSWLSQNRITSADEDDIPSGSVATFTFALKVPESAGTYSDVSSLVAEHTAWLDRSKLQINMVSSSTAPLLNSGESLRPGQSLVAAGGSYRLVFQTDGNLVIYKGSKALWSSRTNDKPAARVSLQADGNLVIYDDKSKAIWASWTQGSGLSRLQMQSDGNLVIYKNNGGFSWASWTNNK